MLLPPGWFLVPDNASGASYYWNTMTNQVSWLHPLSKLKYIILDSFIIFKLLFLEIQKETSLYLSRVINRQTITLQMHLIGGELDSVLISCEIVYFFRPKSTNNQPSINGWERYHRSPFNLT